MLRFYVLSDILQIFTPKCPENVNASKWALSQTAACSLETPSVHESSFTCLFFCPDACPFPSRWGPYAGKWHLQPIQSPLLWWRALISLFLKSSAPSTRLPPSSVRPLRMRAWPLLLQATILCLLMAQRLIMWIQMQLLTVPPVLLWVCIHTGRPVDFLQSFYSVRREC